MDLENIMLNEIYKIHKKVYCMIPLIQGSRVVKFIDNTEWNDVCQDVEGRRKLGIQRFRLQDEESSGNGWWQWSHNSVNMLHTVDLYT